jgi:hypothetical protein
MIAHIFLIGWVVALVLNMNSKDELASFYIRQTLLLHLVMFLGWIPVFGWFFWLVSLILLLLSLIFAMQGTPRKIPFFGSLFQQWFKTF